MSDALGSQFFKPTGFERSFDAQNFSQQRPLRTSHKRTLDDAVRHIDTERDKTSAVSVSLEPGSGKTTVLPFRFSSAPVCVILPTGFDALAAFRLASEQANIDTGNYKESNGSNVTYMDSYTAGYSLFKYRDAFPYKVVIIDESDSNAGITKTLTEVKFKSSFVIHLSGTPEGREINSTTSFETEVSDTLPDLSDVYFEAVDFIKSRCEEGRSLVMVPSAAVARQIHSMIVNSKKIDCEMSVDELDSLILDQTGDQIIVADDSCTRGINLNLDQVFDFQLVTAGDTIRSTTLSEQMQRRMRLGRTRVGKYYYTPREPSKDAHTKWDVFRNNVARAVFGLPLQACDLQIDFSRLKDLMVSRIEPYELQQSLPSLVKSPQAIRPKSSRKSSVSDKMEPWMLWVSGYGGKRRGSGSSVAAKSETSSSSSSSSSLRPEHSVSVVGSPKPSTVTTVPSSSFAPVQLERKRIPATSSGSALPVIDLSTGNMNSWPEALRAAYNNGDTLCMVKPGNWSYTNPGSGVDCLQKLIGVIRDGPAFTPAEMEVVCRAWNILVSRMNFSFASGKDAWGDSERVLFILDYFSSYNNMLLT